MKKAIYPGTFDPLSIGHLDIIKRAASLFDELHVVVSDNQRKVPMFSTEQRVAMIKKVTSELPNVVIAASDDLVVRYAKKNGIKIIVRGLRNIQDYENEFSLYQFNRNLDRSIETIILFPSSKNTFVSSSKIKELIYFDADVSPYVPSEIIEDVKRGK